jgi:hypothetical protein
LRKPALRQLEFKQQDAAIGVRAQAPALQVVLTRAQRRPRAHQVARLNPEQEDIHERH